MNVIINGGSRGIGKETALKMAGNRNNQILVTGRNEEALKELSECSEYKNISYIKLDMAEFDREVDTVKDQIYYRFSKVDILINCAGTLVAKEFIKITNQEARNMMETNFFGPATLIRMLVPLMAKGSHIINISSMGGFQGSPKYKGMSYYSASKSALACLTECLATELSDSGIFVNCLAIGAVRTDMFKSAFPGLRAPLEPKDMAEFISYFAVNGNKFFNGKILPVAVTNP